MIPTCDRCGNWIEHNNHRHPGYCQPRCHHNDRAERDAYLAAEAESRRDRRLLAESKRPQRLFLT